MISVGIGIVTYNNASDIGPLFAHLAQTKWSGKLCVAVIDGGSSDDTVALVSEAAAKSGLHVVFEPMEGNVGYAVGTNKTYQLCRGVLGDSMDYFVEINPDIEVEPEWLENLIAAFSDPSVGAATSLLLLPDGTVNAAGCAAHFAGFGYMLEYRSDPALIQKKLVDYPSGAAYAVRMSALRDIEALSGDADVFWNDLFLYHEDLEFGLRLRLAGWRTVVVPESRVVHKHIFAATARNAKKFWYQERNRWLVLLQVYRWPTLMLLAPMLLFGEVALACLGVLPGQRLSRWSVWTGIWPFIKRKEFWRRRARMQSRRKVSDRVLWHELQSTIQHQEVDKWFVVYGINPIMRFVHFVYGLIIWW